MWITSSLIVKLVDFVIQKLAMSRRFVRRRMVLPHKLLGETNKDCNLRLNFNVQVQPISASLLRSRAGGISKCLSGDVRFYRCVL